MKVNKITHAKLTPIYEAHTFLELDKSRCWTRVVSKTDM